MPVLDFFKKKPASGTSDNQAVTEPQTLAPQQTQQVNSATVAVGQTQSYNGIGNPPGGQAYNGIGNPPAPAVPTTSTTTTSAPMPAMASPDTTQAQPTNTAKPADLTPTTTTAPAAPQDGVAPKDDTSIDAEKRTELDLMTHLTQRSNRIFMAAQQKAKDLKSEFVDSEHVLHGLLADPEIYKLFTEKKNSTTNC
ncbi:MAG: hypothetical protein UZ22_OP11002000132 [Microgenomates bacterium OLB23]|nr:MAG: hypothetical protein UZ22_OP11002000132 [Microgenomates bacterium OLB23]